MERITFLLPIRLPALSWISVHVVADKIAVLAWCISLWLAAPLEYVYIYCANLQHCACFAADYQEKTMLTKGKSKVNFIIKHV